LIGILTKTGHLDFGLELSQKRNKGNEIRRERLVLDGEKRQNIQQKRYLEFHESKLKKYSDNYESIQQEIKKDLEIEYIDHTNRLEGSQLTNWGTEKVLSEKPIVNIDKRFKQKDVIAVQNQARAIKFIRNMAADSRENDKQISEADIKNLHFYI